MPEPKARKPARYKLFLIGFLCGLVVGVPLARKDTNDYWENEAYMRGYGQYNFNLNDENPKPVFQWR